MTESHREAERTLRPSLHAALEGWGALVRADRDQVERLPNRPRPEDFYAPIAEMFRADPRRTDEALLDHLRAMVRPDETWIDVGAGGGRYCLALALKARRVYAVEPSEGMRLVLVQAMAEHGIANIDVFPERWPGPSSAPVAGVGFISHVGYDLEDIGPFLDQLEAHSRRLCVAVLLDRAPISDFAPLWEPVHGEERTLLPGLREFVALSFARGPVPELKLFTLAPRRFDDVEALHRAARRPLWVLEGTAEDKRLAEAVSRMAVPIPGGIALARGRRYVGVVSWEPPVSGG